MERIIKTSDIENLTENKIEGSLTLEKSSILFSGKNNIIHIEDNLILKNTRIVFNGNNGVVFIKSGKKSRFSLLATIDSNSTLYIGEDMTSNGEVKLSLKEGKNIIIGNDCMFSLGIWCRTSNDHLMYDITTEERIAKGKSIIIGDHVWLGQESMILKGSNVGSGSIIGLRSVNTKTVKSNSVVTGMPAEVNKLGVSWERTSTVNYEEKEKKTEYKKYNFENFEDNLSDYLELSESLENEKNAEKRIVLLQDFFIKGKSLIIK